MTYLEELKEAIKRRQEQEKLTPEQPAFAPATAATTAVAPEPVKRFAGEEPTKPEKSENRACGG